MRAYLINERLLVGIEENLARFGFPLSRADTIRIITPISAALGFDDVKPITTNHQAAQTVCVAVALLEIGKTRALTIEETTDLAYLFASAIYDLKEELRWESALSMN